MPWKITTPDGKTANVSGVKITPSTPWLPGVAGDLEEVSRLGSLTEFCAEWVDDEAL